MLTLIRSLHIIATSFVCREEIIRQRQFAQQKEIEQEYRITTELETVNRSGPQAGASSKADDDRR
jgi:hypothetical protein